MGAEKIMNKKTKTKVLGLNAETIKQLNGQEISEVRGGGMCSEGAPTGLCPTQTTTCPKAD